MASYLDQVPKQLSARRKAFRAARDNPALLPSCWAIVRSIGNNIYEYMRNSVIGGCTFPDRPIYLSTEDSAFLNFGATPKLLLQDAAWIAAENSKQPYPAPDAPPAPELAAETAKTLARLAAAWGTNQRATRVYNLEAWLQDMYRDKLDVDFAEDLQRQIDALNAYMNSVPKAIAATGLNAKLSKGVVDAFNLFKTITGSSHQLDREKMSFVDRRSYVNTIQKIELIMAKADESLGAAVAGRSVVREQFNLWKDANYEMMALTRQLRVLWAGTSLDDRIQELSNLLFAVKKAINRCTEESRAPTPQLPMCRADQDAFDPPGRNEVADAFRATTLFDMIVGENATLQVREVRKFGPLSVVVVPGAGEPRYCWEVRKLSAGDDDEDKRRSSKDTSTGERELDVDRRIRYPLNCVVVPLAAANGTFRQDMADAWLEYNQWAFPVQFKEFLELSKNASPAAFAPPEDKEAKDLPPTYARRMLGKLTSAFVEWAERGTEPDAEQVKEFEPFREVVLSRLNPLQYLLPNRYRPLVQLFSEAGARRKMEMWKRCLGPRFALDRQLVAACVLMKDWKALRNWIKFLPSALVKENSSLLNGFAKADDASDPFGGHKAESFFRKFLTEHPDLKSALVSIESQVSIEVETLRTQSESLGRVFQYDQASETMMRRQFSQIQEKRLAANAHIDHYLTGLMYAHDGNLDAAEATLAMCLVPESERRADDSAVRPVTEGTLDELVQWFDKKLDHPDSKFEKRLVPGENAGGTACYDYLYFNLGLIYFKRKRYTEAAYSFHAALEKAQPERSHLHNIWSEKHREEALKNLPRPDDAHP
jgi:tetratricopeptide (TPR) repeat protein